MPVDRGAARQRGQGPPGFRALAAAGHRLLVRIHGQGTSYQQILNDVRKNLAVKFLRETQLSMDEIAERVGFSDSRNFRQAFKILVLGMSYFLESTDLYS